MKCSSGGSEDLGRISSTTKSLVLRASGGSKMLLGTVAHDTGSAQPSAFDYGSGVTEHVDLPRELTNDRQCYQISAVDTSDNEGSRTVELCLTDLWVWN